MGGRHCWSIAPDRVDVATRPNPDARCSSSRLVQLDRRLSVDELRELRHRDRRCAEALRIALPRQNGDGGVRGHEVGQEPVTLVDAVVVVGDGLADRLDFGRRPRRSGDVRRLTAGEPRRIEPHPIPVAVGRQRGDVAEGPVSTSSRGGFVFVVGETASPAKTPAVTASAAAATTASGDERDLHDLAFDVTPIASPSSTKGVRWTSSSSSCSSRSRMWIGRRRSIRRRPALASTSTMPRTTSSAWCR